MIEFLRSTPFMDGDLLDAASRRIQAAEAELAPLTEDDVFVHGDFTPGNILVDKGELTAVLDFEYARLGQARDELAMPWIWSGQQSNDIRAERFLD